MPDDLTPTAGTRSGSGTTHGDATATTEPLPCPWCGIVPIVAWNHAWHHFVTHDCPSKARAFWMTREAAIEAWNRRTGASLPNTGHPSP